MVRPSVLAAGQPKSERVRRHVAFDSESSDGEYEDAESEVSEEENCEYAFPAQVFEEPQFACTTKIAPLWNGDKDTYEEYRREVEMWLVTAEHMKVDKDGNQPDKRKTGIMMVCDGVD